MVMGFHTPPVVGENVEDAQNNDQERSGPLGLETNRNHGASDKTNYGNQKAHKAPLTLNDETKEEENQENATSKQNTSCKIRFRTRYFSEKINKLFLAIILANSWQSSKGRLP